MAALLDAINASTYFRNSFGHLSRVARHVNQDPTSKDSACLASERATTRMSLPLSARAPTAALIRATASSRPAHTHHVIGFLGLAFQMTGHCRPACDTPGQIPTQPPMQDIYPCSVRLRIWKRQRNLHVAQQQYKDMAQVLQHKLARRPPRACNTQYCALASLCTRAGRATHLPRASLARARTTLALPVTGHRSSLHVAGYRPMLNIIIAAFWIIVIVITRIRTGDTHSRARCCIDNGCVPHASTPGLR